MLHENASEVGLPFDHARPPVVNRRFVDAPSGYRLSALCWGDEPAEFVFLHGGAQNAHTWDTVALALGRPLVAIDLPGHGHSDWRDDKTYRPHDMAHDVAHAITSLAPSATTIVGMSLGGLTGLVALADRPELAERLVLIDITPGVNQQKAEPILSFIAGPEVFAGFDEILERTMAYNPTRSRSSLRRGVLHNARELPDGTWAWRYDLPVPPSTPGDDAADAVDAVMERFANLWEAVSALDHPLMLVQGGTSGVVDDDDVTELRRRRPDSTVIVVEGAGHSVQGDQPLELAALLTSFHAQT
jgi:pimeloyl-ACP methyl ester carboxylesterase